MPARRVKTFYKEKGHRTHREHRSSKGRTPRDADWYAGKSFKQRKQQRIDKELLRENFNKYL